jgi:hypothetical protein
MLAQGIIGLEHPDVEPLFPIVPSDNNLKRHIGLRESNAPKNNQLKDKIIKYICI